MGTVYPNENYSISQKGLANICWAFSMCQIPSGHYDPHHTLAKWGLLLSHFLDGKLSRRNLVTCPNHVANKFLTMMHCGKCGVWVSRGCHDEWPQTRWPKTTEIYSLIYSLFQRPEVGNQGVGRTVPPGKALGEEASLPFQLLVVSGVLWLEGSLKSLLLSSHDLLLCVCVQIPLSFLLQDTSHWI